MALLKISKSNMIQLRKMSMMLLRSSPIKSTTMTIKSKSGNVTTVRNGGHAAYIGYRQPNYMPEVKLYNKIGNAIGGFATWWILWHCYHEPGHLFGEFEYEDRFAYTNEELGIPHDSEGLAPVIEDPRTTRIPGVNANHRNIGKHFLALFHDGDTGIFKM